MIIFLSFTERVTDDYVYDLLYSAKEAHMNMLRVWGGKFVLYVQIINGIFLPKLFWPTVRKTCSSDQQNLLKFEAEGWEFAKILN